MKLLPFITLLFLPSSASFVIQPPVSIRKSTSLSSDVTTSTAEGSARKSLLQVAKALNEKNGVFVFNTDDKKELQDAVKALESSASPAVPKDYKDLFLGDWKLLCTTATLDTKKQPPSLLSFLDNAAAQVEPLAKIRKTVQESLVVKQVIRSVNNETNVNRVDHVLEYKPPDSLAQLLDNLPDALTKLNINPLEVSQSSFTLVHKANVESVQPLRTKLALESIIVNVAGTSQFLDPEGADVLGINVPLGEFLNSGVFETTYMDSELRVSRGKVGAVEQLRVFTKSPDDDEMEEQDSLREETTTTVDLEPTPEEPVAEDDSTTTEEEQPKDSDEAPKMQEESTAKEVEVPNEESSTTDVEVATEESSTTDVESSKLKEQKKDSDKPKKKGKKSKGKKGKK